MYWWSLLRQSKQCCCEQRGGHASCITLWPRGHGLCSPLNGNCSPRATTKWRTNFGACWRRMAAYRREGLSSLLAGGRSAQTSLRRAHCLGLPPLSACWFYSFFFCFPFFFFLIPSNSYRTFPREEEVGERKLQDFSLLKEKCCSDCSIELGPPRSWLRLRVLQLTSADIQLVRKRDAVSHQTVLITFLTAFSQCCVTQIHACSKHEARYGNWVVQSQAGLGISHL